MGSVKVIVLRLIVASAIFAVSCGGGGRNLKIQGELFFEAESVPHRLSEYRGKNVMLVLMRTSDVVNQIYMMRLSSAYSFIGENCALIVLSIDPLESQFVNYYRENENLPFPLGIAEPSVIEGISVLGRIQGIPVTYFINPKGEIVEQRVGVIEVNELQKLLSTLF